MVNIFESVGKRFERIVQQQFPDFVMTDPECDSLKPDFHSSEGFWIEAKAVFNNKSYGVRIKKYQIDSFEQIEEPVAYLIGVHNCYGIIKRLTQKTECGRAKFLDRNMNIVFAYFVNREIIQKIWQREFRISKKSGLVYCVLKYPFLDNIINNNEFRRSGKLMRADEFYEINRHEYLLQSPPEQSSDRNKVFPSGVLLHKEDDKKILDSLERRKIL